MAFHFPAVIHASRITFKGRDCGVPVVSGVYNQAAQLK